MLKVAKFGGSSLASGAQFEKVKNIIESDPSRTVVIVSAPGKRDSSDTKVTDLLYLCNAHLKYDVSCDSIFEMIEERFMGIKAECGLSTDLDTELDEIRGQLSKNMSIDYLVSRGEYLNARLMADYLGYHFADSADWVTFGYDGTVDYEKTYEKLREIYSVYKKLVLPGFYGALPNGKIKVFSRGGSDITGALAAAALDADMYENWTDVTGILMVDPKIVENPKTISRVTYDELRELSYMGAAVLHEDTVFPVRQKDIPVNIRNTNDPLADGTIIRAAFSDESAEESARFITGITGKKNFSIISIYKSGLINNMDVVRQVIKLCGKFDVTINQISSGVDGFSLIVPTAELEQRRYDLLQTIQSECEVDEMHVTDGVSLIAIVGRQMAYRTGISGKIFGALGDNRVNIRTIGQSVDEINITVGVETKDFEKATRVLYESFAK